MENTVDTDDVKKSSITEWPLEVGDDLSNSFEITSSQQHLQVISKNETPSEWPVIPATFMEKLSFYRAYTCTVSKIEILCEQQNNVKRFLWFYVFNMLCKSLPMTYVYLFLSSYSPDHPLFLSKMVPLFYGYNFIFLITGFFGLTIMAHNISMYIAYFVFGLIYNIPWNRCKEKKIKMAFFEYTCLSLHEFAQKVNGKNITYSENLYKTADLEYFDLAQLDYFTRFITFYYKKIQFNEEGILLIILSSMWILAVFFRNHISKRYIWQTLHRAQLLLCGVYILSFLHLLSVYENRPINYVKKDNIQNEILMASTDKMMADFDLLAESMTAPPVAYIISSRSSDEVKPSLNSALIITSNSLFYIFRAMTSYLCKIYCENWVNASIIYWDYGSASVFYIWPIYFSTIYTGDILVLVFFALNAIVDYCSFLIAFQCLVQTFIIEWKWIKPWCAAIIIVSAAFSEYFTSITFCAYSFVLWTCISTLSEIMVIFWMYPMGRFIDDITFHYGAPPTKLRVWSFTILRIYYFIKAYIILKVFLVDYYDKEILKTEVWTCVLHLFFLIIGAIYNYYYYVYKEKRNFLQLFKPAPDWGPKNYKIRQLRKQFDSRDYIRSQAPRDLGSHLIQKNELTSYKLDIRYESHGRQTTFEVTKEHRL